MINLKTELTEEEKEEFKKYLQEIGERDFFSEGFKKGFDKALVLFSQVLETKDAEKLFHVRNDFVKSYISFQNGRKYESKSHS